MSNKSKNGKNLYARPFLKWAGGKTQLIAEIGRCLPPLVLSSKFTYVEPFVGSGAVLFWMLKHLPNMEKALINDINSDLINTYKTIKSEPNQLIPILKNFQDEYHGLQNKEEEKKEYYYQKRDLYNARNTDKTTQAALFIFLNRTCFNGLYRVNRSNLFNVPIGNHKLPMICDERNILAVNNALQKVEIVNGDYEKTLPSVTQNIFYYLDPPYKPLSETSNFNSYAKGEFNDDEQMRLKNFCAKLNTLGCKWMLSNCDVKGENSNDNFFDEMYVDYFISRVKAKRMINAKPEKRGLLSELLITNYQFKQALSVTQSAK